MNLASILYLISFYFVIRCRGFDSIRGDPVLLSAVFNFMV